MKPSVVFRAALAVSLVCHAWLLGAAPHSSVGPRVPPPSRLIMLAAPPPAVPPQLEPPPQAEPVPPLATPSVPKIASAVRQARQPSTEPPPTEPPPADAAPAEPSAAPSEELTGTTLASEAGSFSVGAGTGRDRAGPVGFPPSRAPVQLRKTTRRQAHATPDAPSAAEPAVVPVAELGERPVAPDLGNALRGNYPTAARRLGVSGEATVQALVGPGGRVSEARIASESGPGFGDACRTTLLKSHWSPPRDRAGRAVATWISYRCGFRVEN